MNNSILKLKLKRIDPVKYATVSAFLTVLVLLIVFVPFMLLFSLVGGLGATSESLGAGAAVFGGGIVMILFVPLIYGILVFIITLISAMLLNFVLKKTGGLDIDFEKVGMSFENHNVDFTDNSNKKIEK